MKNYSRWFILVGIFGGIVIGITYYKMYVWIILSKISTTRYQSKLLQQDELLWQINTIQSDSSEGVQEIFFYNENIGYRTSYSKFVSKILKTSNGGKNWEKVSSLQDFLINDIFFETPSKGFLVASKLKPSSTPSENGSYIMKTEDGGQTWQNEHFYISTKLNKIIFNSAGIGVVVGRKDVSSPNPDSINFILITDNDGITWNDISDSLNKVASNINGDVGDYLTHLLFSKYDGIYILSIRGKIYNTINQGKSWTLVNKVAELPEQMGVFQFGILESKRYWVAGGTGAIEGKQGMIAIMNNRYGWDLCNLEGYVFSSIQFISDNEIVAVGSKSGPNNFSRTNEQNKGVILYSTDSGKNWSIIYESQISNQFNSIAKLSEQKFYVVGDNGVGVILEKKE